ncbi:MAG: haloacid dehalogenase-like hydrolase [Candidatus Aenigmatarchaeota archaeon]
MEDTAAQDGRKRVAFEDIDGTAYMGYVILDFINFVATRDRSSAQYATQFHELERRARAGDISYREYAEKAERIVRKWIAGKKVGWLKETADAFVSKGAAINRKSKEIHDATRKFAKVVAVTAEPYVIAASLSAGPLPFDDIIATDFKSRDGIYTGEIESGKNLFNWFQRSRAFRKYVKENGIDASTSIALGDSPHDAYMFDVVGFPVLRNPVASFEEQARKNLWLVFRDQDPLELYLNYVNNPREHWEYWCRLMPEQREIVRINKTLYNGNWDVFINTIDSDSQKQLLSAFGFKQSEHSSESSFFERAKALAKKLQEYDPEGKKLGPYVVPAETR